MFVQGLARGLGYEGSVSSKSFVLMGEYCGRLTLYHADLYRLDDPEQVDELALEEISREGVLAVEWPERAGYGVSDEYLLLRFDVLDECERRITTDPHGERSLELARELTGGAG